MRFSHLQLLLRSEVVTFSQLRAHGHLLLLPFVDGRLRHAPVRTGHLKILLQPVPMLGKWQRTETEERLAEIAEILAAGLMRLKARKSSGLSTDAGESSLDCHAHQSGHANALKRPGGSE
jgi:hypothetical protein